MDIYLLDNRYPDSENIRKNLIFYFIQEPEPQKEEASEAFVNQWLPKTRRDKIRGWGRKGAFGFFHHETFGHV